MRPANPGVKLTYEDFVLFPDDGKRHEWIDGEHYVTPSPNTRHQRISGNLHLLIKRRLYERVGGPSAGSSILKPTSFASTGGHRKDSHAPWSGRARQATG